MDHANDAQKYGTFFSFSQQTVGYDRLKWLQYYGENLGIMRLMQVKILNSMHTFDSKL